MSAEERLFDDFDDIYKQLVETRQELNKRIAIIDEILNALTFDKALDFTLTEHHDVLRRLGDS